MSSKQGGKGKQSSQSDRNYWARIKAQGGVSRRKAKRIAASKQAPIDYGRQPPKPSQTRVVFSGNVEANFPRWAEKGYYPYFVIVNGVTIDVCERETSACIVFKTTSPRLPGYVAHVSPVASTIIAQR